MRYHEGQDLFDIVGRNEARPAQGRCNPRRAQHGQRAAGRQPQRQMSVLPRREGQVEDVGKQFRCRVHFIDAGPRRIERRR